MKNKILKGITTVAVLLLILCMCLADSQVNWIYELMGACMLWIGAMMIANYKSL